METKSEHLISKTSGQQGRKRERGNALIYVLIAIALFAALSFTLGRQTDSGEAGSLDDDRAEIFASQLISYASQAKNVIDQMDFQGIDISKVDFTLPSDTTFNSGTTIYKIYHPDGGGLNLGTLSPTNTDSSNITTPGDPPAGWYMGRFNDVEWSALDSGAGAGNYEDIILVAYGINGSVCRVINNKIDPSLSPNPPLMTDSAKEVFIERQIPFSGGTQTRYTTGANVDLTTQGGGDICTACDEQASLCVQDSDGVYAFYSVLADR